MTTTTVPRSLPEGGGMALLRPARPRYGEYVIRGFLFSCAALSVLTTFGIIFVLAKESYGFFREVSIVEFFTSSRWTPLFADPEFGVRPLVIGTIVTTIVALSVAIPLGLGSSIYLSEYASPRTRQYLKPMLELLAGVPTVVYGFFAVKVISPIVQDWWPIGPRPSVYNGLSAGLVMGIMIIPIVASLSEDAMSAVPDALRQGAYAMGSTKREVASRVVVPAALSGIVASFVLAFSRAVGETMIVLVAAGGRPTGAWNPGEAMMTMTSFIAATATGDVPTGSIEYKTIFAVGALLFAATFVINLVSIRIVRRYREAYE